MFEQSVSEISKEQFEHLQNCEVSEFHNFIENEAAKSLFPPCAYGFSSPSILYKDDKYFVVWKHWDSCD